MKAIVDATPLIALSIAGRLDVLPRLFDQVIVPAAVWAEVVEAGENRPGADELRRADWLDVLVPAAESSISPALLGLDAGELQALQLAVEHEPDFVIIDERLGRRAAAALGLQVTGTVGVLLAAYRAGLIDRGQVMEAVEAMTESGVRLSRRVLEWLRYQVSETP